MKKVFYNRYNLAFIFLMVTSLWALFSFFTYHIAPLPERMPEKFTSIFDRELHPGEAVYLTDQRYDAFVWNHPNYNIFPGGGRNADRARTMSRFFLVGSPSLPSDFKALEKDFSVSPIATEEGVTLWRFTHRRGCPFFYRLSDAFPEGVTVRSSQFPDEAPFRNGEFIVGNAVWERVKVKTGEFGTEKQTALSVHPLNGLDQWVELIVDPLPWKAKSLSFGYGIASSGDCKGTCSPVKVTVVQGEKTLFFETTDGVWRQADLTDIAPDQVLAIRVVVEKAGRRHFYCDLFFHVHCTEVAP